MAPHTQTLVARDDGKGHLNNTYIAGIAVVCAIVVGTAIWLSIHWYRARVKARQEAATHAASTRGSVFVDGNAVFTDKHRSTTLSSSGSSAFSRKDAGSAVMPEPLMTKEEILEFHRQNGTLTHAFKLSVDNSSQMSESSTPSTKSASPSPLPSPSSLAVPARAHTPHGRPISIGKVPRPGSSLNPEFKRSSFNPGFQLTSVTAAGPGERPISTISLQPPSPLGSSFGRAAHSHSGSGSSLGSFLLSGGATERTVRQTFSPILPDELVIRPGERLTVVQNLDDGWCIVGRGDVDTTGAVPKGEFGQKDQDSVEMGAVPAWVFVKPVKGLIGQRPLRTTSLGVTVQVSAPVGAGHEVISWSNF